MAEQQTQPQAAQPQAAQPQAAQPLTPFGIVEKLLAGVTVASATIYVLINALYIEFYDDFGVRPEDVGWDRLTVLGRAAWIALVGIAVVGTVLWIYATIKARTSKQDRERRDRLEETKKAAAKVDRPDLAQSIYERNRLQEQEERRELIARLLGPASLASAVLILVGFYLLEEQVEEEAALAKQGVSVDGVGFIVPFIDARTTRAKVTWLGDKEKRPTELESPHLTYLGRGRDVTVLLACGRTTVLVPADDVAIDLFNTDRDMPEDQQRQRFNDLCGG